MKFLVAVWLHDSDTGGSGTWLARLGWQQQHVWATHSRVLQWYGGHPANCLCRTMSPGPHPHWESVLNVLQFWHTGNILADIGMFLLAYVVFEVYEHLWSVGSNPYFFSTNPLYSFYFFVPLPQHTISHLQMFFLLVTTACGRVRWQRGYPSGCSFWWQTLPGPHLWWRSLLLGKWWWRSSWAWRQHVSFFVCTVWDFIFKITLCCWDQDFIWFC